MAFIRRSGSIKHEIKNKQAKSEQQQQQRHRLVSFSVQLLLLQNRLPLSRPDTSKEP